MNFLKRLFKIGAAEANSAIDNIEDPIKMTEQGIRDMKVDLNKSLEALAQVKALAIRAKNDTEDFNSKALDYEQKAMLILKKAQKKEITSEEADRLAKEALTKKEENLQHASRSKEESAKFDNSVNQLDQNVQEIKKNISKWENELKTLKARVKVSKATKNLNKQMAEIDSSSTVAMLERMKEKVSQEEALSEAYGDIADSSKSLDQELEDAININESTAEESLAKLKKKLGMNGNS